MTDYVPPPADDKDWTWVVDRTCPQCGFDAAGIAPNELAGQVLTLTAPWADVLARADVARRTSPEVWSPLEYGCHVRDLCRVFTTRTRLMLDQDNPTFQNWDQDGAAAEDRYHEQDPAQVAADLAAAAATWAASYGQVGDDQWNRAGLRGNGAAFTITTLGRYGLHDLAHHLTDVGAVAPGTW